MLSNVPYNTAWNRPNILLLNLCDLPPYTLIWHYTFIRHTRVLGILVRTNLEEMASNVSGGIVKLIEKDVSVQPLCSAISRITVCITYNDGWSVEE